MTKTMLLLAAWMATADATISHATCTAKSTPDQNGSEGTCNGYCTLLTVAAADLTWTDNNAASTTIGPITPHRAVTTSGTSPCNPSDGTNYLGATCYATAVTGSAGSETYTVQLGKCVEGASGEDGAAGVCPTTASATDADCVYTAAVSTEECLLTTCTNGTCTPVTNQVNGTACTGGECYSVSGDEGSSTCQDTTTLCANGIKDDTTIGETNIDCGGACGACPVCPTLVSTLFEGTGGTVVQDLANFKTNASMAGTCPKNSKCYQYAFTVDGETDMAAQVMGGCAIPHEEVDFSVVTDWETSAPLAGTPSSLTTPQGCKLAGADRTMIRVVGCTGDCSTAKVWLYKVDQTEADNCAANKIVQTNLATADATSALTYDTSKSACPSVSCPTAAVASNGAGLLTQAKFDATSHGCLGITDECWSAKFTDDSNSSISYGGGCIDGSSTGACKAKGDALATVTGKTMNPFTCQNCGASPANGSCPTHSHSTNNDCTAACQCDANYTNTGTNGVVTCTASPCDTIALADSSANKVTGCSGSYTCVANATNTGTTSAPVCACDKGFKKNQGETACETDTDKDKDASPSATLVTTVATTLVAAIVAM